MATSAAGNEAKRRRKSGLETRVWNLLNWVFLVLLAGFIVLHLFPGIVFQNKLTAHGITVHSRSPLPPSAVEVMARAATLVAASELAIPGRTAEVYVADQAWVYSLFRPFKKSFAVAAPWTNNVFIANGDFDKDLARSRQPVHNTRVLSAVMAHEITHGLIVERLGLIDTVRTKDWVKEGYCDYVAREGSFPEKEGLALLAAGRTDPSSSFDYFVGRQLVTYLIEQKKMSFEQIAAGSIASPQLRASTAAEMARR